MGKFTLALGAAALFASIAPVIAAPEPATIGFKFEKKRVAAADAPHRLTRRQTISVGLDNEILLYFINCTVGTPPQPFSLQIDTGSSDIWFPAVQADICQQDPDNCPLGTYDASASSTYVDPDLPEFQIQYVDGTQIAGAYLSDVLNVGGTQLTNMTMAAALQANTRGIGIMGIGFESGESSAVLNGFTYPNVINVMKNEGKINTLAYSLWLDDLDSNTGVILFGGVDTNKYHGDLISLPIQLDEQTGTISSFTVAWTGLTVHGSGPTSDFSPSDPQPAILDSGTTDTLLPDDIANSIFNGVGVLTDPQFGNVVRCSLADDDLTFTFTFGGEGGAVVNVSLSEFVTPLLTTDGSQPTFENGDPACSFAIEAAGDNPILFGDSFLRSAYVVYDLENAQIGLAQTNFDSSKADSKVEVFQVSSGIPNVVSTASAASVAQSFTGIPRITQSTATATGELGGGTSRSATFNLTPATATSTSGSGSGSGRDSGDSNAASANFRAASMEMTSVLAAGVVVLGFVFGGGLMLI
ncbi:putative aspartic-type endopeptidase OPSB [Cladophialophora carrionii]|uniref:Putative aspartic-type endopeptidase OPSB n=1 Tax=Cladophialophora carrionii TaxID=86049 RepID=A0A1C1CGE3_9EURO|nr:putative aspartic-type endopeptidase OPSB [Cladophialophora carrionii]